MPARVRVKDALRMSVSSNYIPIRRIGIRQNAAEVKLMSSDDKYNSGDV